MEYTKSASSNKTRKSHFTWREQHPIVPSNILQWNRENIDPKWWCLKQIVYCLKYAVWSALHTKANGTWISKKQNTHTEAKITWKWSEIIASMLSTFGNAKTPFSRQFAHKKAAKVLWKCCFIWQIRRGPGCSSAIRVKMKWIYQKWRRCLANIFRNNNNNTKIRLRQQQQRRHEPTKITTTTYRQRRQQQRQNSSSDKSREMVVIMI